MASADVATRFLFQECEASDVSDNDDTESLLVALQKQGNSIHGQVSNVLKLKLCEHPWIYRLSLLRLTLILSCSMNFALYPHDTQECKLQMESRKSEI